VATYNRVFAEEGIADGMKDVIAVVVQPGVEFGDEQVFLYDHDAATELCGALKEFPQVCFEGHSTDYQSADCLKNMVQDGIAILKVGPALTYGLREALFALSLMEKELVPEEKQAHFIETLDKVMMENPANWQKHYHGDDKQLALARKYSFSDRCRYYIGLPEVVDSMNVLFNNLREYRIPMNMLHQYMPLSYLKVRDGIIPLDPKELALDGIQNFMSDYEYAVGLA
jgi:D-tagatose-1,6-bisphosphate aldolase subunit GatZ/KbaZ